MNVAPQRGSRVGGLWQIGIVADLGYTLEVRRSGAGASLACASLDFIARPDDRVRRKAPHSTICSLYDQGGSGATMRLASLFVRERRGFVRRRLRPSP